MSTETEAVKQPLSELKSGLTKRNLQYVHEVEKHLQTTDYSGAQKEQIVYEMTEKILIQQKQGVTARKLFDLTPTEYVAALTVQTKKASPQGDVATGWIVLDGALLVLGAMMLITGLSALMGGQTMGIVVLLITGGVGGFAMLILRKYAAGMREKEKGATLKYILVAVGVIFVWMFIMTFVQVILPPSINVSLDPIVTCVIGALALVLKFYVKRKKNIPNF
ncbi:DUF1129 domain-containing protein [Listeria costaricensis]|uniref:DUF1129 domain-containing protein n=1 Tax=Listeria costaricensis TaxID=2026604 RepID=UPI000C0806F5|nr:DUF1129 family protein [Listeria costaricensis]